jgi:hypothetical protein
MIILLKWLAAQVVVLVENMVMQHATSVLACNIPSLAIAVVVASRECSSAQVVVLVESTVMQHATD